MNLLNLIPGKKTYMTGIIAIATGVTAVVYPSLLPLEIGDPGELIVIGLGLIFLRKGIKDAK